MDNDGDTDVLGAGYLGHQIAWWRNEGGDPVNWTKQLIATGVTNACVAYAIDLDTDDDLDVIATAQGENEISWWRNDGNGSTDWTKFIITDDFVRPWPLFAGDFDEDNDIDIISGSSHQGSNEIKWWENDGIVGINENISSKDTTPLLLRCYPNPFNTSTTINYEVKTGGKVKLSVFDTYGNERSILVDQFLPPGFYNSRLKGDDFDKGIYYYPMKSGNSIQTKKMIVNK